MMKRSFTSSSSHDDPQQAPDLTIEPYDSSSIAELRTVPVRNDQLEALNALLKMVPAAIEGAQSLSQTYRLTFAPHVAKAIRAGTYTVIEGRAIAVNAQGQIMGHGTLVATTGIQLATVALAAWQVLAVITAQHYLPQITQSLAAIEQGIHNIHLWLEAQEKARLISDLKRLRETVDICAKSALSTADATFQRYQLESIYHDADQIVEATALRLADQRQQLANVNPHTWFGSEAVKQELIKHLQMCESTGATHLLALKVKTIAVGQLALLGFDTSTQRQRLTSVVKAIDPIKSFVSTYTALVIEKYKGLGGPIDPWGDDNARREAIAKQINQARHHVGKNIVETVHLLTSTIDHIEQHTLLEQNCSWVITTDTKRQIAQVYACRETAAGMPMLAR